MELTAKEEQSIHDLTWHSTLISIESPEALRQRETEELIQVTIEISKLATKTPLPRQSRGKEETCAHKITSRTDYEIECLAARRRYSSVEIISVTFQVCEN